MNKPTLEDKERYSYGELNRFLIETLEYISYELMMNLNRNLVEYLDAENKEEPFGTQDVKRILSNYSEKELRRLAIACHNMYDNLPFFHAAIMDMYDKKVTDNG